MTTQSMYVVSLVKILGASGTKPLPKDKILGSTRSMPLCLFKLANGLFQSLGTLLKRA